tara:strand:- start:500 stop:958 length:459 start_codon:yes stop_codon:yes gene_type:complete
MKTDKVKKVTPNGTWEGKFGMMYKFEVEFENGDCGEYSSKSKDQTKFVEGQNADYEFTAGKFPKVKPFYALPQNNGQTSYNSPMKKNDNVQELIVRQSSLKAAVDYCRGSSCSPEEVCENAQLFAEWVLEKKMKVINETNEGIKESNNDLPF